MLGASAVVAAAAAAAAAATTTTRKEEAGKRPKTVLSDWHPYCAAREERGPPATSDG